MANTKFPLQINNSRFYVNPTGLAIQKAVNYAGIATQNGTRFQVWYDGPEVLTITGESAGSTAYNELALLKREYEKPNKVSELFYKTRIYRGFITNITVEHNITHINRFAYTITFQLLNGEQFAMEDFALTRNEQGVVARTLQSIENFINQEINVSRVESQINNFFKGI